MVIRHPYFFLGGRGQLTAWSRNQQVRSLSGGAAFCLSDVRGRIPQLSDASSAVPPWAMDESFGWSNTRVSMMGMSSDMSISQQIDRIIKEPGGWRSTVLSQLRVAIKRADPAAVEEVKWKKPTRPMGIPVWCHDGNVCIGEALKNAVRLTFPKGALIKDPKQLFNARLDSNSVRAIDFHEGDIVDQTALKALIVQAVRLNTSTVRAR